MVGLSNLDRFNGLGSLRLKVAMIIPLDKDVSFMRYPSKGKMDLSGPKWPYGELTISLKWTDDGPTMVFNHLTWSILPRMGFKGFKSNPTAFHRVSNPIIQAFKSFQFSLVNKPYPIRYSIVNKSYSLVDNKDNLNKAFCNINIIPINTNKELGVLEALFLDQQGKLRYRINGYRMRALAESGEYGLITSRRIFSKPLDSWFIVLIRFSLIFYTILWYNVTGMGRNSRLSILSDRLLAIRTDNGRLEIIVGFKSDISHNMSDIIY